MGMKKKVLIAVHMPTIFGTPLTDKVEKTSISLDDTFKPVKRKKKKKKRK